MFTSVLCGVNNEVKENKNKKRNPILACYIQTRGGDNNLKGEKHTKLRAQWILLNASEAISVWNCCNAPAVLVAGSTGLFNKPNSVCIWCNGRPYIFAILNFEENMTGIEETN